MDCCCMSCLPTGEYFITFHVSSQQHLNPVDALSSIGGFSRAFWQSTSLVCDNQLSSLRVAAAVPVQYLISIYILRCWPVRFVRLFKKFYFIILDIYLLIHSQETIITTTGITKLIKTVQFSPVDFRVPCASGASVSLFWSSPMTGSACISRKVTFLWEVTARRRMYFGLCAIYLHHYAVSDGTSSTIFLVFGLRRQQGRSCHDSWTR